MSDLRGPDLAFPQRSAWADFLLSWSSLFDPASLKEFPPILGTARPKGFLRAALGRSSLMKIIKDDQDQAASQETPVKHFAGFRAMAGVGTRLAERDQGLRAAQFATGANAPGSWTHVAPALFLQLHNPHHAGRHNRGL